MPDHKYLINKTFKPNEGVLILELKNQADNTVFEFKPGQYLMLSYFNQQGNLERKHAFSIASSPSERNFIRLAIKIGGNFTQGLAKKPVGTQLFVSGPYGSLFFDQAKHQDLVVIAGGIGITPFFSMLEHINDQQLPNKLSLIYSNKTIDQTLFFKEIETLAKNSQNIRTLLALTDHKGQSVPSGFLAERLNAKVLKEFIGELGNKHFFICGPQKFMEAMNENLLSLGARSEQIKSEDFSMIAGAGFSSKLKNFSYTAGFSALLVALVFYLINNSVPALADKKIETGTPLIGRLPAAPNNSLNQFSPIASTTDENSVSSLMADATNEAGTGISGVANYDNQKNIPTAPVNTIKVAAVSKKTLNNTQPISQPPTKPITNPANTAAKTVTTPTPTTSASAPVASSSVAPAILASNQPTAVPPAPTTSASTPIAANPSIPAPTANSAPSASASATTNFSYDRNDD